MRNKCLWRYRKKKHGCKRNSLNTVLPCIVRDPIRDIFKNEMDDDGHGFGFDDSVSELRKLEEE